MDEKERVGQLASVLMELRMAGSQAEAEHRARAVIASSGNEGPSASSIQRAPMMPASLQAAIVQNVETPAPQEYQGLVITTKQDELSRALSGLNVDSPLEHEHSVVETPMEVSVQDVPAAPEPQEPAPELDQAVQELAQVSEDETKESFNAQELQQQMEQLERELQNSRKEVDMLRQKLSKTEEALAKAQTVVDQDDHTLGQPQQRPVTPNHQKPRGTNPPVDLSKIFGR